MTEGLHFSLADVLQRLQLNLAEPIDFSKTDTDTTLRKVHLLTATATYFNTIAISDYHGRLGPLREEGLLEHVLAAAFQTYEGHDPHPAPFDKAAMLFRGITQGHPFNDGNKRTGFLLSAYYLELVGIPAPKHLDEQAVIDLCLRLSTGALRDLATIAAGLQQLWGIKPKEPDV